MKKNYFLILLVLVFSIDKTYACDFTAVIAKQYYYFPMHDSAGQFNDPADFYDEFMDFCINTNSTGYGISCYKNNQVLLPYFAGGAIPHPAAQYQRFYSHSSGSHLMKDSSVMFINDSNNRVSIVMGHGRQGTGGTGQHPFWVDLNGRTYTFMLNGNWDDDIRPALLHELCGTGWFAAHPSNWYGDSAVASSWVGAEVLFHWIMYNINLCNGDVLKGMFKAYTDTVTHPSGYQIYLRTRFLSSSNIINSVLSDGEALYVFRNANDNGHLVSYKEFKGVNNFTAVKTDATPAGFTPLNQFDLVILSRYDSAFLISNFLSLSNSSYFVSGAINTTTWSSNKLITGDVTVNEGQTLTIQPNVTISFLSSLDQLHSGYDTCKTELIINGELHAAGTSTNKITFKPTNNHRGIGWYGIIFENQASDNSILQYCNITYATKGLTINFSNPSIYNNEISFCKYGIYCSNALPDINSNAIYKNSGSGIYCYYASPSVERNKIYENKQFGIYCYWSDPYIGSNDLNNNYIITPISDKTTNINIETENVLTGGIYCYHSSPYIKSNSISSNNSYGIICNYSSPAIRSNNIFSNITGIYCTQYSSPALKCNNIHNNQAGIKCYKYSSPDVGNCNNISNNNYGLYASSNSNPYGKYSSFISNSNFHVYANTGCSVIVENNWWGTNPPDPLKFGGSGLIDYIPYLTGPLAYTCCLDDEMEPDKSLKGASTITPDNIEDNNFNDFKCYPNPFTDILKVRFALLQKNVVMLSIYNMTGQKVCDIINKQMEGGEYSFDWDGKKYPAGLYKIVLITGGERKSITINKN